MLNVPFDKSAENCVVFGEDSVEIPEISLTSPVLTSFSKLELSSNILLLNGRYTKLTLYVAGSTYILSNAISIFWQDRNPFSFTSIMSDKRFATIVRKLSESSVGSIDAKVLSPFVR